MARYTSVTGSARRASGLKLLALLLVSAVSIASTCTSNDEQATLILGMNKEHGVDTTYVGDLLTITGPTLFSSHDTIVEDVPMHWASANPAIAALTFDASQVTVFAPNTYAFSILAAGTTTITATPSSTHFVGGVIPVYTHTIVALPTKPNTLTVDLNMVLRIGEIVLNTPSVRTGPGSPLITSGDMYWSMADTTIAGLSNSAGTLPGSSWHISPLYNSPHIIGIGVGTTTATVTYVGGDGLRLQQVINIYVVPSASRAVMLRPSFDNFVENAGYQFGTMIQADVIAPNGSKLDGNAITFTARDPGIATVTKSAPDCRLQPSSQTCTANITFNRAAVLAGPFPVKTWIVAGVGGVPNDSIQYTVYPAIAAIDISPTSATVALGGQLAVTLTPRDGLGRAIPLDGASEVTLRTSTEGFTSATDLGLHQIIQVIAIPASGNATLTYHGSSSISNVVSPDLTLTLRAVDHVTVTPAGASIAVGATRQYAATGFDAANRQVTLPLPVTWRSASGVATINSSGLVTAASAGTTTITATINGVDGSTPITVTAPANPVSKVVVIPTPVAMTVGDAPRQLIAQLYDAGGLGTDGTVAWSTDASNVASVDAQGRVTAVGPGVTAVTAFVAATNVFGRALVSVASAGGVSRITVAPFHVLLTTTPGSNTWPFAATAVDVSGNNFVPALPQGAFTWVSSNTAAATVDGSGNVTAVGTGGAIISATKDGQRSEGAVSVGAVGAVKGTIVSSTSQYLSNAQATAKLGTTQVAQVNINPFTGQFYIPGLAPGTYSIVISVNGYSSQTVSATVTATQVLLLSTVTFP